MEKKLTLSSSKSKVSASGVFSMSIIIIKRVKTLSYRLPVQYDKADVFTYHGAKNCSSSIFLPSIMIRNVPFSSTVLESIEKGTILSPTVPSPPTSCSIPTFSSFISNTRSHPEELCSQPITIASAAPNDGPGR